MLFRSGQARADAGASIAVVPLTVPLLTGPATISTMVIYAEKTRTFWEHAVLVGYGVVIGLATFIVSALVLLLWIPRTLGRLFLRLCVGDLDYLRALLSAASRWREILEIRTRLEETSRLDFLQVIDLLESENRAHDKTLFQKPEGGTSV